MDRASINRAARFAYGPGKITPIRIRDGRPMITNPGARTRVLYNWEAEVLKHIECPYGSERQAQNDLDFLWEFYKPNHPRSPRVHFLPVRNKSRSYCYGRSDIYLSLRYVENNDIVLMHELVHAFGYGSVKNPHSVGFVRKYIELISRWSKYSYPYLAFSLMSRGLLPAI